MKKLLFTLAILFSIVFNAIAQENIRKIATWNMKWLGTNSYNQLDAIENVNLYAEYILNTEEPELMDTLKEYPKHILTPKDDKVEEVNSNIFPYIPYGKVVHSTFVLIKHQTDEADLVNHDEVHEEVTKRIEMESFNFHF